MGAGGEVWIRPDGRIGVRLLWGKSKNVLDFKGDKSYALGMGKKMILQEGFYHEQMDRPNRNSD